MQLRLPRPKDDPPKRKRAPIVSTADAPPCGICHKQLSRYTCPACNLPYCSLSCFKAEEHRQCSEAFSRNTLKEEVQGGPQQAGAGEQDKQRMMHMLKEFEEQQRELEELEGEDADEDEDDSEEGRARRREREELEKKLAGVNIDSLSPDDLLALLTPSQQSAFQSTLQDPTRVNKLVDDYFEGDEPWWIVEEERKVLKELAEASKQAARAEREKEGAQEQPEEDADEESEEEVEEVRPPIMDQGKLPPLPKGSDGKAAANPKLAFNVVAVLFAYAYTLRTFALTSFASLPERSTERIAAIQVLSQLLPFLVERSTSAFEDVDGAVESVMAREEANSFPPELVTMLLQDLASLLRPAPISAIAPVSSSALSAHSLASALSALSDLSRLFSTALATSSSSPSAPSAGGPIVSRPVIARPSTTSPLTKQQRQHCTLASAKLAFYASLLVADAAVPALCRSIAEQVDKQAEMREKEREEDEAAMKRRKEELRRQKEDEARPAAARDEEPAGPKIVEL
ncbi:hypothetical protein JCM10213_004644 [Rhodosporidiobolus nylandii]